MPANAAGVIKKDRVRRVPPDPAAGVSSAGAGPAPAGEAQVRLLRKEADHGLLEVCCPCGNVIRIQCRWEVPPAGGKPAPAGDTDAPQPNKEATQ